MLLSHMDMTEHLRNIDQFSIGASAAQQQSVRNFPSLLTQKERDRLLQVFYLGVCLFLYLLFQESAPFSTRLAAVIISFFAILPTYLWIRGKASAKRCAFLK